MSLPFQPVTGSDWPAFKQRVLHEAGAVPGWCTPQKAALLMDLVAGEGLTMCVDVGAFGGASCLPIAEALRYRGSGVVHAVDAWDNDVALAGLVPSSADWQWWRALDFEPVHAGFRRLIARRGLRKRCRIVRMESRDAASTFEDGAIDLVHFDGAHSEEGFFQDVLAFWPKVRDGGYLLVNDAAWACMRKGLAFLMERARMVKLPGDPPHRLFVKEAGREVRASRLTRTRLDPRPVDGRPTVTGLFWWRPWTGLNFGDELSRVVVGRMAGARVAWTPPAPGSRPLLFGIGSILQFARDGDMVWGSGFREPPPPERRGEISRLDVRAVRGPLTRECLLSMGIPCPPVYGDPALLLPRLFPELVRSPVPRKEYIVLPNIGEIEDFRDYQNLVLPTAPWRDVVNAILDSRLVISSSLHGLIVAEAFGVPARLLRMPGIEPMFKYEDYYLATGRDCVTAAGSVGEALEMGGEAPARIDLQPLVAGFPGLSAREPSAG